MHWGVQLKNVLIDSGATCNIVDHDTLESLKQEGVKCRSQRCERKLFSYGQSEPIEVVGTFEREIYCEASGERCVAKFTIVESHGRALLGRDTAKKLNVLRLPAEITCEQRCKTCCTTCQKITIWSKRGSRQEIRRITKGRHNRRSTQRPTGWVSPLVLVLKPDKDICICVDMRRADEAIERERHPIPTINEILHDLNGSTVFSKLDLKWGFHQVELDADGCKGVKNIADT